MNKKHLHTKKKYQHMYPMIRSILLLFLALGTYLTSSAQSWEYFNPTADYWYATAVELPNGQVLAGEYTRGDGQILRFDNQGNILSTTATAAYPWLDLDLTSNNKLAGTWMRGTWNNNYTDSSGVLVMDAAGNVEYSFAFLDTVDYYLNGIPRVYPGDDGDVFAYFPQTIYDNSVPGFRGSNQMVRLDSLGNVRFFLPQAYSDARFITAGGVTNDDQQFVAGLKEAPIPYWYAFDAQVSGGIFLQKLDNNGNTLFDKSYLQGIPANLGSAVQTTDGGYLAAIDYLNIAGLRLWKFDAQGDSLWRTQLLRPGVRIQDMVALPDSGAVMTGLVDDSSSFYRRAYIARTDKNGNLLWENDILPPGGSLFGMHIDPLDNGGFLVSGVADSTFSWVATLDSVGELDEVLISGKAYLDLNSNCVFDGNDVPWSNAIIKTTAFPFYAATNSNGDYIYRSVVGTQYVGLATPYYLQNHPPMGTCNNSLDSVQVDILVPDTTVTDIDFPFTVAANCPFVNVIQCGFSNLRPCSTSVSSIYVRNYTSNVIPNAHVIVTLDSDMTLDSASIPYIALGNNMFRFDFTNLQPFFTQGSSSSFMIWATVDCNAVIGQSICTVLEGFPQDTCTTDSLWSGALIDVEGACVNDTVEFTVKNIGNSPMQTTTGILIAEDDILKHSFDVQFGVNEDTIIKIPGNGRTWTLIADQVANSPYAGRTWSAIEACDTLPTGGFSTGHVLTTVPSQLDPHYRVSCREVRNSYDPNDKRGYPYGVGTDHDIAIGDNIEYMIRFQNTGNDTAFTVIIKDQLPSELDPGTIALGVASHPYSFRLLPNATMEWTFLPIALPDSATNPAGSQGFVTFQIDQVPNLPVGTEIKNAAEIYFDFNPAVITDTSLHTIQETIRDVILSVDEPLAHQPQLIAWPNPAREIIHVRPEEGVYESLTLEVYDLQGRLIAARKVIGEQEVSMEVYQWNAGTYLFRLRSEQQDLGHGKMIVH